MRNRDSTIYRVLDAISDSTSRRVGMPACPPRRVHFSPAAMEANRTASEISMPRTNAAA